MIIIEVNEQDATIRGEISALRDALTCANFKNMELQIKLKETANKALIYSEKYLKAADKILELTAKLACKDLLERES